MAESILESDNQQVKDERQIEEEIMKIIEKIKKDRNRASYQNIHNFLNRRGIKMEMENVKKALSNLTERNVLINKGKESKESFWITNETFISESRDKNELEAETGIDAIKEFIDDNFYATLVDRIKTGVKDAIHNLITSDDEGLSNHIVKNQDSMLKEKTGLENLITILKKDIDFLRKELQSKDLIINMSVPNHAHLIKNQTLRTNLNQTK